VSPATLSDDYPFNDQLGWTTLPGFLSEAEVVETIAVCAEFLELPVYQRLARDKPFAGTRHLVELDDRSELISSFLKRAELNALVAAILGPAFRKGVVSYRSPQPSFGGQKLHADGPPKSASEPNSVATAIIALTAFTEDNGSTRLVPGSHLRPDLQRHSGSLDGHPDEVLLTGAAGTAFVFSGHILHSGTTNSSSTERPALQLLWHAKR